MRRFPDNGRTFATNAPHKRLDNPDFVQQTSQDTSGAARARGCKQSRERMQRKRKSRHMRQRRIKCGRGTACERREGETNKKREKMAKS